MSTFRCSVPLIALPLGGSLTVAVKALVILVRGHPSIVFDATQQKKKETSETNAINCHEVRESSNEAQRNHRSSPFLLAFILKATQ